MSAMISTGGQSNQYLSVRRPALFTSPVPGVIASGRLLSPSASPTPARSPSANSESQAEIRVAILGALGVGKSALVVKYITKRFIMEYDPYLEDIYNKTEALAGRPVKVRIMDTCESSDKKPERYLKWANAFIVVYSIVCRPSFDEASRYLEAISHYQRLHSTDVPFALVGNKADLERYRTVSQSEAETLASRFDCCYFETSAAEDQQSVTEAFTRMLCDVIRQRERQPSLQSLFISEDRQKSGTRTTSESAVEKKDDVKLQASNSRRSTPGFKLFNKGFRIFN